MSVENCRRFFRIPRNSQICFPSIEQNVLAQFPAGSDVQCFYHLYKIDEVQNLRSGEKGELAADNYQPFESMIGALTSTDGVLERWDFEQVKAQGDTWADDYASLRNLIYQLNSLHTVTSMIETFNPDFVVFVRPDIFFHNPLPPMSSIIQRLGGTLPTFRTGSGGAG